MRAKARKLEASIEKLMDRIEDQADEELCAAYDKRIAKLQKELKALQTQIREAESVNAKQPKPLPLDQAVAYLNDFRKTMNAEIPVAAEAIRKLTGPITIHQEPIPGRNDGTRWLATFSPDLIGVLRSMARERNPDILAVENGAAPQPVEVVIDKVPKYERLAPVFKQMRANGASVESIAHVHGMSRQYAKEILDYADTGQRPKWKSRKRTGARKGKTPKHIEIAEDVVRMRDVKLKPFSQIAAEKGVSYETVCRAYDHVRPEAVREAAEKGETPKRGHYSRLGAEKFDEIRKLLREGKKDAEVAAKVGCGHSTVARERHKMKAEGDDDQAA